jgi:hypothetical protein
VRTLTDPVFDGVERCYSLGYPASAARREGPALKPSNIPELDAILLSHAHHSDNFDESGKKLFGRARANQAQPLELFHGVAAKVAESVSVFLPLHQG